MKFAVKYIQIGVTTVQASFLYLGVVIILALVSFGFLLYEWWPGADPTLVEMGDNIDLMVACLFLVDFFAGFFFNTMYANKKAYWKYNWLDFVSSIPITTEVTQLLRILRIWRATKVIRVFLNLLTAKQQADVTKKVHTTDIIFE